MRASSNKRIPTRTALTSSAERRSSTADGTGFSLLYFSGAGWVRAYFALRRAAGQASRLLPAPGTVLRVVASAPFVAAALSGDPYLFVGAALALVVIWAG